MYIYIYIYTYTLNICMASARAAPRHRGELHGRRGGQQAGPGPPRGRPRVRARLWLRGPRAALVGDAGVPAQGLRHNAAGRLPDGTGPRGGDSMIYMHMYVCVYYIYIYIYIYTYMTYKLVQQHTAITIIISKRPPSRRRSCRSGPRASASRRTPRPSCPGTGRSPRSKHKLLVCVYIYIYMYIYIYV